MPSHISSQPVMYQSDRFKTWTDTRRTFYVEPSYADGDSMSSGGWETVGAFFAVDNPSDAVQQYFSLKDESPFLQQARALGKAYRDVLKRQNPLPDFAFAPKGFFDDNRARDYNDDYIQPGLVYSQRCRDPLEVAGKLLGQVGQPKASNQAQEILVELSAMSLAAAGFQGYAKPVKNQQVFGEPYGFQGHQLPWWKKPFVHKDVKPVRVARHLALLNAVKAQGVTQLQTPIDPRLSAEQYAEQLVHRGKMMIICAPTAVLHQQADLVHRLAEAVDAVDSIGLAYRVRTYEKQMKGAEYQGAAIPDAFTKRSPEVITLVNCLNEAAEKLFPNQDVKVGRIKR